jgi:hypothetical protein
MSGKPRPGEETAVAADDLGKKLASQTSGIEATVTEEDKQQSRDGEQRAKEELRLAHLQEQVKNLRNDRRLRKRYAGGALGLAQCAVVCWIILFTITGITNSALGKPFLSDMALATLTAGATVNVLAALIGVIRGLFPPAEGR